MPNIDMNTLIQYVQHTWSKLFKEDITEIRNADKIIYELQGTNEQLYILKGEKTNLDSAEHNCQFANQLNTIFPTPLYIKSVDERYTVLYADYILTLEEKLTAGSEINALTDGHLKEIAANLGKMHKFSLHNKIRLNKATSWSMFGGNKTLAIGDYDENELSFRDFEEAFQHNAHFASIKKLYLDARNQLVTLWPSLPKAATQGDFCYYNMRFDNERMVALFDFNLAGDEVLVNECVAVGIYSCWHVPYTGQLPSDERFQLFMEYYKKVRPLTDEELHALPHLFSIIRAFRYNRIEAGIANAEKIDDFIEETTSILLK
ncbi:hypothetical protein DCE79_10720 [Lysinibacillus sp. 2017]|uniref:hypothetical protein n=1 Tax=unclassified Lysinibacillus TaxID=2636778 RepID=UPI000D526514|nr:MULTISPECIES: hypothetical protein [unclassified Lysinibacillus]AWE07828.1 hypothetical protein DCE79_10720 [Lysinibacillus sp. 2017]TGN32279.1 hypothetical protein E4L99_15650 [Lysinibacillus sp. S2017]